MAQTDIARLRAVADHAEHHGLGDTIGTIGAAPPLHTRVYVTRAWGSAARPEFARWVRSIGAATARRDEYDNYVADGVLDDGTPVRVSVAAPPRPDWHTDLDLDEIAAGGESA